MQREPDDDIPESELLHRDSGYSSSSLAKPHPELSWLDDVFHDNDEMIGNPAPTPIQGAQIELSTGSGPGTQDQQPLLPFGKLLEIGRLSQLLTNCCEKLGQERHNVLLQRDQSIYEWNASHYKYDFVEESHNEFARALEAVSTQLPSDPGVKRLKELYEQIASDYQAFQEQGKRIKDLEERLRLAEGRLQRKEQSLVTLARKLLMSVSELGLPVSDQHLSTTESSSRSPLNSAGERSQSQKLDPLVASFYDKIADVRIMRDRLAQLLAEHDDERAQRSLQQDQEANLEVPDAEFQANFEQDLAQTNCDVSEAIEAATAARAACEEKGVAFMIDESLVKEQSFENEETPKGGNEAFDISPPSPFSLGPPHKLPWLPTFDESDRQPSSSKVTTITGPMESSVPPLRKSKQEQQSVDDLVVKWMDNVEDVTPELLEASSEAPARHSFPSDFVSHSRKNSSPRPRSDQGWMMIHRPGSPLMPPAPVSLRRPESKRPLSLTDLDILRKNSTQSVDEVKTQFRSALPVGRKA